MLSFLSHWNITSFVCILCVCWQQVIYYKVPDIRIARLLWQFPCHIACSAFGLVYGGLELTNSMYEVKPKQNSEPYAFFYGYWFAVMIDFLRFFYIRDRDFYIMLLHHLTTFTAIASSDWLGYRQVGLYVFLVHDISDIFIMLLKIVAKLNQTKWITPCYVVCLVMWIYFRVWKFVYQLVYGHIVAIAWQMDIRLLPCSMLFILASCNLYWTKLLLQLACKKDMVTHYEHS